MSQNGLAPTIASLSGSTNASTRDGEGEGDPHGPDPLDSDNDLPLHARHQCTCDMPCTPTPLRAPRLSLSKQSGTARGRDESIE